MIWRLVERILTAVIMLSVILLLLWAWYMFRHQVHTHRAALIRQEHLQMLETKTVEYWIEHREQRLWRLNRGY